MWGDVPMAEVQSVWGEALGDFIGEDIRDALAVTAKHYPDYPPTCPQFVGLCRDARKARAQSATKLPSGPRVPCPPEVRAQIDKFLKRARVS